MFIYITHFDKYYQRCLMLVRGLVGSNAKVGVCKMDGQACVLKCI